jgi:predicted sulfurtransferase
MPGTPVQVEGGGSYWTITPAQLHDMLAKKDFFMVNTDIAYTGEIEGTDLFVKPDALNQNLDKFPADKSKKIVVYCAAGVSSQPAAAALVKAGYTRVMQLKGGMIEWQRQGYPILNKSKTETGTTTTSGGM